MEFIPKLVDALWGLKSMCEQHGDNKKEIAKLLKFIEDYKEFIPRIEKGIKQLGLSITSSPDLQKFKVIITDASKKLNEWAADRRLFRVLSSAKRMQELEHLHKDVMAQTDQVWKFLQLEIWLLNRKEHNEILARLPEKSPVKARPVVRLIANLPTGAAQPPPFSNTKRKFVNHSLLKEDHQLAAAEEGGVYVIVRDPRTNCSSVWMSKGQRDFVKCDDAQPAAFRSTSPPTKLGIGKLYVGGKLLSHSNRPAVMVWDGRRFMCSLQSTPEAHEASATGWKYTFLARACTGSVIYCGCSDGTIETWDYVATHREAPRSYIGSLEGHEGAISVLAVQRNDVLLSLDDKQRNIVRVWRKQTQVAVVYLKHQVHRMTCTMNRNMYVVTKRGSTLWCDLEKDVLGHLADNKITEFGMEIFSPLPRPSTSTSVARACRWVEGTTQTMYCLSTAAVNQGNFFIEEWHGKEFVGKVDTGLKKFQSWTVPVYGTVCISPTKSSTEAGKMYEWKFTKSTLR